MSSVVPFTVRGVQMFVTVVDMYKHLGTMFTSQSNAMPEIKQRLPGMRHVFNAIKNDFFAAPQFAIRASKG
eukprot:6599091-Karenia_brevis.AAC.1